MSGYQFNKDNSNPTGKGSFFQDEDKTLMSPEAIDAGKDYQKMRLNTPIDPDYRILNTSVPAKKRMTADDLINQVMSITPAKPVYDAQRPEEIKRLMKANALSEAFRTMGETFSLAKGGTVNRREPNTKNDQYQNALWNTIDNYNQKTDAWNNQDYMRKIQKGLAQVGQINKDREFSSDLAKQKYNMARDNRNYQLDKDKFDADKDYKKWLKDKGFDDDVESKRRWDAEFKERQNQSAETARHNQEIEGIQSKRAEGTSKTPILYDDQGNEILRLRPSEEQKLMGIILNDPAAQNELALLKPTLGEPLSAENKKYLIAKYWNKFPASIQYVNQLTGVETPIAQPAAPGTQVNNNALPGFNAKPSTQSKTTNFTLPGFSQKQTQQLPGQSSEQSISFNPTAVKIAERKAKQLGLIGDAARDFIIKEAQAIMQDSNTYNENKEKEIFNKYFK